MEGSLVIYKRKIGLLSTFFGRFVDGKANLPCIWAHRERKHTVATRRIELRIPGGQISWQRRDRTTHTSPFRLCSLPSGNPKSGFLLFMRWKIPAQICRNMSKCVNICRNVVEMLSEYGRNMSKYVEICRNMSKYCRNISKYVEIRTKKPNQNDDRTFH